MLSENVVEDELPSEPSQESTPQMLKFKVRRSLYTDLVENSGDDDFYEDERHDPPRKRLNATGEDMRKSQDGDKLM